MKTKFLILFFAIILHEGTISASTKIGNLYYNLNSRDMTAEVTFARYQDASHLRTYYGPDVTIADIPNEVNGYKVTRIGSHAFSNCKNLTSVTIGKYVTSIGEYAFDECSALTTISINKNINKIDDGAFNGCISLPVENNIRYADTYLQGVIDKSKETYSIKEGTRWIGSNAFNECHRLKSINIPESVIAIRRGAFYYCDSLSNIIIPDKVTLIGESAFERCNGLKSLTMGKGIQSVGNHAFYECDSLATVNINDLSAWCSIDFDSNLLSNATLFLNGQPLTDIIIPNNITRLGKGIFAKYSNMSSLKIPSNITFIGKNAFANCSFASVIIPNSVDTISATAFENCTNLKSVIIGQKVRLIENDAFANCRNLSAIVVGKDVRKYAGAFKNCFGLNDVNVLTSLYGMNDEDKNGGSIIVRHDQSNPVHVYISNSFDERIEPWTDYLSSHYITLNSLFKAKTSAVSDIKVTINEPTEVTLEWPEVEGATLYMHEVKQDGKTIISFVSNEEGQCFSGDFSQCIADYTCQNVSNANFTGNGWYRRYSSLQSGTTFTYTVTAMYDPQITLYTKLVEFTTSKQQFTVSFYNWDGELLLSLTDVEEGTLPVYTGETPTRPNDDTYTYQFIGWTPEIVIARGYASYYATYEAIPISSSLEPTYGNSIITKKVIQDGTFYITLPDGKIYNANAQSLK
ncbi:MAG: leucine-rich repeat domain-containing protein [Paludibacteraceae bacterium]|nr:leucine-rich repeat domain-containing protein [Paludibacteraceae bacterium]